MSSIPVKMVDNKGRVSLGKDFADHLVLIKRIAKGIVQVTLAEAVPANEAWLHKNKSAFASVMRGLEQTAKGEFAEPPDLQGDASLADGIEE